MDYQQILTIIIAICAVAYLVRRAVHHFRSKQAGCGSCSSCPAEPESESMPKRKQLYSLRDHD